MFFGKKKQSESKGAKVPSCWDYELTEAQQLAMKALESDADGFVKMGDVARNMLNQQAQYVSEYFDGSSDRPVLTEGLRTDISSVTYHGYRIHREDVHEFVARVTAWRNM